MIDWLIIFILCIPITTLIIWSITIKWNKDFIIKKKPLKEYNPNIPIKQKTSLFNGFKSKPKYFRRNETHNR